MQHSFDDLVDKLLSEPYGNGACGGCHKPYALVNILRADEQYPILSAQARSEALDWLRRLSQLLERSERSQGGWDLSWPGTESSDRIWGDEVFDRITVVGHHLEWIALAPLSVRPMDEVVQRAVSALVTDIKTVPNRGRRSYKSQLPCSHAARALCLLHGSEPYQLWGECWEARESVQLRNRREPSTAVTRWRLPSTNN